MSKSFAVVNGDLGVSSGRSFDVVTGRAKLAQDLRLWILEKIGNDPMTPTYGSRLDGGVIDGQPVPSFIGQIVSPDLLSQIRNEIQSQCSQYQAMQFNKIRSEALVYGGRNTLEEDEVLSKVEQVDVKAMADIVVAQVKLTTLSGLSLTLTVPLQA